MTHSDNIEAIAKAMIVAQGKMEPARKNSTNPAFRSKYADLAAVVDAVMPSLTAAGIAGVQSASSVADESGLTVRVESLFLHESGQWIRADLALRPTKSDPQGVGSAITYGRRYLLLAMAGIAPEDDDGNAASKAAPRPAPAQPAPIQAAPAARASTKEWTKALVELAQKLPREEVLEILKREAGGAPITEIPTREMARTVYAVMHSLYETLGGAA